MLSLSGSLSPCGPNTTSEELSSSVHDYMEISILFSDNMDWSESSESVSKCIWSTPLPSKRIFSSSCEPVTGRERPVTSKVRFTNFVSLMTVSQASPIHLVIKNNVYEASLAIMNGYAIMCRCFTQLYRILIVYENWPRRRREYSGFFGKFSNLKSKIKDICLGIFPGAPPPDTQCSRVKWFLLTKNSKCRVKSVSS